jgi:ribosomal protein L11 methyltransferase
MAAGYTAAKELGMIEATLTVPPALGPQAEAFARDQGVWGYALEDADTGLLDAVRVRLWLEEPLSPAAVAAALGAEATLAQRAVNPADWTVAEALPIGQTACWTPPGVAPLPGRTPLWIEAGAAFGDGAHPSTALCVDWIEGAASLTGSLLDVGTGTGLLLILAALRGAGPLAATELDPAARAAAGRAFGAHGLSVDLGVGLPAGPFDWVLANLPLHALLPLAADLVGLLGPGGRLVLAGFVAAAEPALKAALPTNSRVVRRQEQAGWVLWEVEAPAG